MQSQLFAALTLGGEKSNHPNLRPRCCGLEPPCHISQSDRLNIALNSPLNSGFSLLRLVSNNAFDNRHSRRSKTKRLSLDQGPGQLNAIQLSLDNQLAAASLAFAAGSSCAAANIDFDLSSFIIGEGVVTARFILMVR